MVGPREFRLLRVKLAPQPGRLRAATTSRGHQAINGDGKNKTPIYLTVNAAARLEAMDFHRAKKKGAEAPLDSPKNFLSSRFVGEPSRTLAN